MILPLTSVHVVLLLTNTHLRPENGILQALGDLMLIDGRRDAGFGGELRI